MTYGMKATRAGALAAENIADFSGTRGVYGWFWVAIPRWRCRFTHIGAAVVGADQFLIRHRPKLRGGNAGAKYILKEEVNAARWAE